MSQPVIVASVPSAANVGASPRVATSSPDVIITTPNGRPSFMQRLVIST